MISFPKHINVENIKDFQQINYDRVLGLFRDVIYINLLTRKEENEYIDLDTFSRQYCNNNNCMISKLVQQVILELHELGWKTKMSFADTGLFIYSTENPPPSCW